MMWYRAVENVRYSTFHKRWIRPTYQKQSYGTVINSFSWSFSGSAVYIHFNAKLSTILIIDDFRIETQMPKSCGGQRSEDPLSEQRLIRVNRPTLWWRREITHQLIWLHSSSLVAPEGTSSRGNADHQRLSISELPTMHGLIIQT